MQGANIQKQHLNTVSEDQWGEKQWQESFREAVKVFMKVDLGMKVLVIFAGCI